MTRNCDLGLFPRLIEQWRLEEEAKKPKKQDGSSWLPAQSLTLIRPEKSLSWTC